MPEHEDLETLTPAALAARVRRLTEQMQETQQRLQSLLTLTHELVCCIEFDQPVPTTLPVRDQAAMMLSGRIADCNETFARLYAYSSPDTVVGQPFMKLVGTDDESVLERAIRFIRSGYQVTEVRNTERLRDGSVRHLENSSRGEIHDGCLVRVWIIGRDVTTQQLIEAAQRDHSLNLPNALASIDSAFWIVNWTRFETLYVGTAVKDKWGVPRELIVNDPLAWIRVVHPADRTRVRNAFLANAPTGHFDETFRVVLPDGTIRWFRDQAIPLPAHPHEDLRIVGIAQDVTRSRVAESGLNQLLRLSNEMLFVLDAAGTVRQCSAGLLKHLNRPEADVLGRTWGELLHPEDQSVARQQLSALYSGRPAVAVRCRLMTGDGSHEWIEWNSAPADDNDLLHCVAHSLAAEVDRELRADERNDAGARLDRLSPREREVLQLVAEGKPSKVIAHELFLSPRTVEKHRANLMKKLQVSSLADAIRLVLMATEAA
jgi:PAS domain S-box-containing protein